jgi:hypothetical protein
MRVVWARKHYCNIVAAHKSTKYTQIYSRYDLIHSKVNHTLFLYLDALGCLFLPSSYAYASIAIRYVFKNGVSAKLECHAMMLT